MIVFWGERHLPSLFSLTLSVSLVRWKHILNLRGNRKVRNRVKLCQFGRRLGLDQLLSLFRQDGINIFLDTCHQILLSPRSRQCSIKTIGRMPTIVAKCNQNWKEVFRSLSFQTHCCRCSLPLSLVALIALASIFPEFRQRDVKWMRQCSQFGWGVSFDGKLSNPLQVLIFNPWPTDQRLLEILLMEVRIQVSGCHFSGWWDSEAFHLGS